MENTISLIDGNGTLRIALCSPKQDKTLNLMFCKIESGSPISINFYLRRETSEKLIIEIHPNKNFAIFNTQKLPLTVSTIM